MTEPGKESFTPMSHLTIPEIEHVFWSMKDSKNEEKALEILASLGVNPFERLFIVRDLIHFGKLQMKREAWENEHGYAEDDG
jgi:hypothetical protein